MPKTRPKTKEISAKAAADSRDERVSANAPVILVGTYRPAQMEKWILPQGLYNYPVQETDTIILEDAPLVSEVWLYNGKADKRRFSAKLERRISADELDGLGYPKGMGKHHGREYLLFRVKPIADETPVQDTPPPHIDIRLSDFAHDRKLQARLKKRFTASPAAKPTDEERKTYFDWMPDDLYEDWLGNLCVCEAAEQLSFDYFFKFEERKRHELSAVAIINAARKQKKPTCVEICAGAGGQAIGLDLAGFEHVALVEYEREYCDVLKANRPDWNVICGDVREFDGHPFQGVDLLAGGVPCPPFSAASKQLGESDERDLFPEAIRLVAEIRPRAVMLENVRGFLDPKFDDYRKRILSSIADLGYSVTIKLLNASDYGVPQLRPRIVIVGIRNDEPGHFEYPPPNGELAPTVGAVLHDLMAKNGWRGADEWAEKADKIAPTVVGGSKKHGGPDLGPVRARRAWAELGVDGLGVASDAPPPDFSGTPKLTKEMLSRIQGFPPEWDFGRKKTSACRMIGNAFPPPVAQAVGLQIRKALEHETKD